MTTVITFGKPLLLPIADHEQLNLTTKGITMKKGSVQKIPSGGYGAFDEEGKFLVELDEASLRRVALEMESGDDKAAKLRARHESIKRTLDTHPDELGLGVARYMEDNGVDFTTALREFTGTPRGAKLWEVHLGEVGAAGGGDD